MTRALLVVDVQNDFCEGGALGVEGGNAVAKGIARLLTSPDHYDLVAASRDYHAAPPNDNCGHFALEGEPDFVKSWPVHCVEGTQGSNLHGALYGVTLDAVVRKGYGTQSYSAFEGVTKSGISLLAILRSQGVTELDVCGIATDYCVLSSVRDALGTGFSVRVLSDLCAGVAEATSLAALQEMADRGANVVDASGRVMKSLYV